MRCSPLTRQPHAPVQMCDMAQATRIGSPGALPVGGRVAYTHRDARHIHNDVQAPIESARSRLHGCPASPLAFDAASNYGAGCPPRIGIASHWCGGCSARSVTHAQLGACAHVAMALRTGQPVATALSSSSLSSSEGPCAARPTGPSDSDRSSTIQGQSLIGRRSIQRLP